MGQGAAAAANFPPVELFTIDPVSGGWAAAEKKHFADDQRLVASALPEAASNR